MEIILFLLLALISEVAGTIGGFGSSVIFVPLAGFFFDFHTVLLVTGILHVFSNTAKLILFRKGIDWKLVMLLGIPSIFFVIIGAILSKHIKSEYIEFGLGIFLITIAAFMLFFPKAKVTPTNFNAIAGGGIAGFLAGLIGTGGAIRGLSLAAFSLEKNIFIATSAAIDFGVDFSRTIIYWSNAALDKKLYIYIPILLVVAFVGSYIGKLALKKVSQESFKKIVLIFIILIGITMIFKFYNK